MTSTCLFSPRKLVLIGVALLALAGRAQADVLAQYNFNGSLRTSSDTDLNSSASLFNDGPGITGTISTTAGNPLPSLSVEIGTTAATQALAVSGDDYFTFTISPTAGFQMNFTNLTFDTAIFGNITATFFVRSSVDNFVADIGITTTTSTTFTTTNIPLTAAQFQNLAAPVTFRVYVFDTADTGNRGEYLDNIILNGNTVVIPEPATYMLFGVGLLFCAQQFRRRRAAAGK